MVMDDSFFLCSDNFFHERILLLRISRKQFKGANDKRRKSLKIIDLLEIDFIVSFFVLLRLFC